MKNCQKWQNSSLTNREEAALAARAEVLEAVERPEHIPVGHSAADEEEVVEEEAAEAAAEEAAAAVGTAKSIKIAKSIVSD